MPGSQTRRTYLAGIGLLVGAVLAGCTDTSGPSSSGGTTQPDATPSESAAGGADDLDLREANVVGVTVDSTETEWRFDVTLIHDDDGEEGFANWWQVETRDGESLGRRELLHAHGTREFTRSKTISIPDTVSDVVVRGHDQTHGYGGQAMIVTLETGQTDAVQQGSDPDSFS
jgi:hypothetical protein